jgi:hypothetical protein
LPRRPGSTEEAFAALLQMPGPPDVWRPESSDGTTPMSQDELIAALADWKQQGANFNAYRHKGPLLHHALRLDQQKIALWLLRHGAEPTQTIELSSIGKADALGLAIHKGQWHVVDAMLLLPSYKRLSTAELTERYLPGSPQALFELMARGFAPPAGLTGSCMLAYELHRGSFAEALKLPATTVPPMIGSTAGLCRRRTNRRNMRIGSLCCGRLLTKAGAWTRTGICDPWPGRRRIRTSRILPASCGELPATTVRPSSAPRALRHRAFRSRAGLCSHSHGHTAGRLGTSPVMPANASICRLRILRSYRMASFQMSAAAIDTAAAIHSEARMPTSKG